MIPEGWQVVAVQDIAEVVRGASPRPKGDPRYYGGNVPRLMVADVTRDGKYVSPKIDFLTEAGAELSRPMPAGTLTIVCSGVVGVPSILSVDSCIHDGFLALRNVSSECDIEYLYYIFFTLKDRLDAAATHGGIFTNLTTTILKEFQFTLPPLPEQRAIAAILGTWDKAITLTEQRIAAAEQRKKALMQQLLTGRIRFPEFAGEAWLEMHLGDFLTMELRKVPKPSTPYSALGIRSHGKGTFHKEVDDPDKVSMSHLYEVKTGDLIVSITFAWEGAIALVGENDNGRLVSHRFPTYVFNRAKVEPDFFKYVMLTKLFFYKLGLISPGGAGRNRVMSKRDFLKIKVKLPPLAEQKQCTAILCAADKELALLTQKRAALQRQKKGLMQRLLTGRVRVKV